MGVSEGKDSNHQAAGSGERDDEDRKERLDRELIELLNELRVALPGVQVLFAFLLTVPFSQRFGTLGSTERYAYFLAFLCAAAASAFLIAPTAYHRIQFRSGDKERLLKLSTGFSIAGLGFLAVSIAAVIFVISDVLFTGTGVAVVTIGGVLTFALLWGILPLYQRLKS